MKIIDQTPFINHDTGEISLVDRAKATMKYGSRWIKEVEGQRQVIPVLGKVLDKNYTLLCNVMPPGLETSIPFILVGPAGVFAMYVTALNGTLRAKGDRWGIISGNTFKDEKPNLLTRTEQMARAIQIFLQRQGFSAMTTVDAILLCSDPSVHVDSIRPIVRVIMRDALERFVISIMQARIVLSPESIQDIIDRILNPPKPVPPEPAETVAGTNPDLLSSPQGEDPFVPAFSFPESQAPAWNNEPGLIPNNDTLTHPPVSWRKQLNRNQWVVLIVLFVIWCFLITSFLFLIISDQQSLILSLIP
jgi:hypothetical protein